MVDSVCDTGYPVADLNKNDLFLVNLRGGSLVLGFMQVPTSWQGTGGSCREPGIKGAGKFMGCGRREGGKQDSQGGEKNCNIALIFFNRFLKSTKRWEPQRKGAGTGCTRYGKWEDQTPPPPPPPPLTCSFQLPCKSCINNARKTVCAPRRTVIY